MEKLIRILHVLGRLDRGGAETMIMNLYRNIDRSNIQFDFVIHTDEKCDYSDEIKELGGIIYNLPRYNGINHSTYRKAWKSFFTSNPEYKVIHGHLRSTASIYLKLAKKYGLLTIAHSHSTASRGNLVEKFMKNVLQFQIRYIGDYLFACSDKAGKWLFGKKAIKKENYRVIRNAIEIDKYKFNDTKREIMRERLEINNKFVLGNVGNFTDPKNHKYLLNLFNEILIQNENAMLLLVGDGELRPQVECQIKALGISENVILTGNVSNANEYLHAMDIFVFPSKFEGLGLAVIEAQVNGLKCIVSNAVPEDAFISNLIEKLPLKSDKREWRNKILHYNEIRDIRNRNINKCNYSDYSIKENALILQMLYLNMIGEKVDV